MSRALFRARELIRSSYRETASAAGWPHYVGDGQITAWGGTVEGIRALLHSGGGKHPDPQAAAALVWLKSEQHHDGGWGSWEIVHSCTEATAWTLVTLELAEQKASPEYIHGVEWLQGRVQRPLPDQVAWGAFRSAKLRVYPTLLATWALLAADPKLSAAGATWLLENQAKSGGWGFEGSAQTGNVAMTAMSLYVLGRLGFGAKDLQSSIDWLWARRRSDGQWDTVSEDWISWTSPNTGKSLPAATTHYSTPWVVMAFLTVGVPLSDARLADAVAQLLAAQDDDGAWICSAHDPKQHIWALANSIWALDDVADAMDDPVLGASIVLRAMQPELSRLRFANRLLVCGCALFGIMATIGLTGSGPTIWHWIASSGQGIGSYLAEHRGQFVFALLSAAVVGMLAFGGRRLVAKVRPLLRGRK